MTDVRASSPLGQARIDGSLHDLWTSPGVSLKLTGEVSLSELSSAAGLTEPPAGTVAVAASAEGPIDDLNAAFSLASESVGWRHAAVTSRDVSGALDATGIRFEGAAGAAGGALEAAVRVELAPLHVTATSEWRDVSVRALAGPDAPVDVSALLDG